MKFLAAATLFGFAAAAVETVTISNFVYVGVNGYPQISFQLSVDGVSCAADHYTVDSLGNKCDNPEWTFDIFEAQGRMIRLHHTVDGVTHTGDFRIRLNGPIPTVLDQIGTATADLDKITS
ncbi:hypothetical protein COCVIDRAFT_29643 [Bipolaris victoriae FI3]|uniref:AA1-like domain-containing protein n=1 Tax=Bipolaris victoriae (strain FI3) TaxID=930091 RepID=W7DZI3_BIPV3|nr:hypothetical protein COCVIDRAFT_29643 [Bipolaris victoriae FI3]